MVLLSSFMLLMQEVSRQAKSHHPGRDSWSTSRAGLRFHNEERIICSTQQIRYDTSATAEFRQDLDKGKPEYLTLSDSLTLYLRHFFPLF